MQKSGVGAWSVVGRIHVHATVRTRAIYLWPKRHADGNECPGFSDASPIIVHAVRSSAAKTNRAVPRGSSRFFESFSKIDQRFLDRASLDSPRGFEEEIAAASQFGHYCFHGEET